MKTSDSVKIVVTVPESHADLVRNAIGNAGGGQIGNYSHCSFSVKGEGRFKPEKGANPFLGEEGALESVVEERIEVSCSIAKVSEVVRSIRKAHPYEEPVIDIYPLFDESGL